MEFTTTKTTQRIINVSNRLPIKLTPSANGQMTYQSSEGGLATALSSVFEQYEHLWIGWPGADVADENKASVTEDLAKQNLYPVFLTADEIKNYYEGFSNSAIWPLFHYFSNFGVYDSAYWESYVVANAKFAQEIVKCATKDDIIWIHDYQLMLLPSLIRKLLPGVTIGYFQHIPFPAYDIFRELPWRKEILNGLLGADVVGFQTEDDVRHFNLTVHRVLKHQITKEGEVALPDRNVTVHAFPISIDYTKFQELASHPNTAKSEIKVKEMINNKLAISIDRLDYSKGIIQRLKAYDLFLQQHPEWHEQITLLHLVVPSRDKVQNYAELKEEMNRMISDINGRYATLNWQPICHFYRSFNPYLLSALYKTADVALVTPVRDGMNLVSKEYVASNINKNGVLILSETAGAARELADALQVNPNDQEEFAEKIFTALTMNPEERKTRMSRLQSVVENADIFKWARTYLFKLEEINDRKHGHVPEPVTDAVMQQIDMKYLYAGNRLILLDYDGTLVPFNKDIYAARPDTELLDIIERLSADKQNKIVIISGRDGNTLEQWLGHLPIDIIAEHGATYKEHGKNWFTPPHLTDEWKKELYKELNNYANSIPGSFIEEKAYSIAWHYRGARNIKQSDITRQFDKMVTRKDLQVLHGNKVVEIKKGTFNKGIAASKWVSKNTYDFILAIGDDTTDEDMFRAMPPRAVTIKVGVQETSADYTVDSYIDVRELLQQIQHEDRTNMYQAQLAS